MLMNFSGFEINCIAILNMPNILFKNEITFSLHHHIVSKCQEHNLSTIIFVNQYKSRQLEDQSY